MNINNCTVGDIHTTASSGSSSINIKDSVIRDITGSCSSGSLSVNCRNINITSDSTWAMDASSGSLNVNIYQTILLGADVSVDAETSGYGDIDVNFEGNSDSVRARFAANNQINIKNSQGFINPDSKTLKSSNYGITTHNQFNIKLTTDIGDIEITAINSNNPL
jgi:hypothetical protein